MFPSNLEKKKTGSQLFRAGQTLLQLFGERKKWIPAIWRPKMYFTTVRSKEKDYDIYLKSEKLVQSQQEHEKNISQLFGSRKIWFLAISNLTNTVAYIWREKKVDPCYFETKKCSPKRLGARKKIMTSIQSQKNWFTASRSKKNMFPCYLEMETAVSQLFQT